MSSAIHLNELYNSLPLNIFTLKQLISINEDN